MNKGKTIFAQIMSLFNEYESKKCVDRDLSAGGVLRPG